MTYVQCTDGKGNVRGGKMTEGGMSGWGGNGRGIHIVSKFEEDLTKTV